MNPRNPRIQISTAEYHTSMKSPYYKILFLNIIQGVIPSIDQPGGMMSQPEEGDMVWVLLDCMIIDNLTMLVRSCIGNVTLERFSR